MDFQVYVSSVFRGSGIVQYSICAVIMLILFRLEAARRSGKSKLSTRKLESNRNDAVADAKKFVEQFAPEIIGLAVCLAMAFAFRMNTPIENMFDDFDKSQGGSLKQILQSWPLLLTADTLLSLQAMLRLSVVVSSILRTEARSLPLSQETAAISCVAMLGRVLLVLRSKLYMLDGPLGGYLPMAFDLVSALLLAILTSGISQKGLAGAALALLAAACIGSTNYLRLAGEHLADGLFIAVQSAEIFAALAYLSRALFSDAGVGSAGRRNVALWFAHILMPIQASLSAYFFIEAFRAIPVMVGAGYPFVVLHLGGLVQVAAYSTAAVIHVTPCEAKELEPLQLTQHLHTEPAGYGELQLTQEGLP